jgi:hypothetical protein
MMNTTAIKSELSQLERKLAVTTDKFDIHFLQGRIASLKAELAGVVKQDYNKVIA